MTTTKTTVPLAPTFGMPWEARALCGGREYYIVAGPLCLARGIGERTEAAAMAAAPELLAVARRLLREDADGEYTIGLIEDARAAIAKAGDNHG